MNMQNEYEVRMPGNLGPVKLAVALIAILAIALVIATFFSTVYISGDQVGIVEKKFGGGQLPEGRILAPDGQNGIQAQTLKPGWHFFYWPWQYKVIKEDITEIRDGQIGLIQAVDGIPLPEDTVYAPQWDDKTQMLDAEYFLTEGGGYKGPQLSVLPPGQYRLNTMLFKIKPAQITNVEVGTVGVIKSNVGKTVEGENRLVPRGFRGVWQQPLGEGQYYLNTNAYRIVPISIRQQKVSYTTETETIANQPGKALRPITVRSKDGFTFPVDVRVTYLISPQNAPKVVATVGDDELVLNKLVTPSVRAIFRNTAEQVKALDYVQNRSTQEKQSTEMLSEELDKYGISVLAVRIGDIGDKETLGQLLQTQTDREIALQEQETFQEQQRAAEKQKALTRTQQEAEEEKRLATASYGVKVAEQDKQKQIIEAEAQAEQVKLIAQAQAEAYQLVSDVIGSQNAALVELMKMVGENNINITPQVMVESGAGSTQDALMGTILKQMLSSKEKKSE